MSSYRETLYRRLVRRGIKILNQARPGWANEINLRKLNLASCELCVLGQLYSNGEMGYYAGRRKLADLAESGRLELPRGVSIDRSFGGESLLRADSAGFCSPPERNLQENYKLLDRIWREEIKAQRKLQRVTA